MKFLGNISKIVLSLCLILALSCPAYAKHKRKASHYLQTSSQSSPAIYGSQNLASAINNAIYSIDPNLNIGIAVKSMKSEELLYTHNANRSFMPASILKVFTAEAALLHLGPNYKFPTRYYTDATEIKNGILNGNIYLVHSGDPTLTYYDLAELTVALKSQGINLVEGSVYIDTTAYDHSNYGPGWVWNDRRYCYAAPISASIINHNCLSFRIEPGKNIGHPASIIQSPRFFYSGIQSTVTTKTGQSSSCYIRLNNNPDSTISIAGCMPKGHYGQGVTSVISDVDEYDKAMIRHLFAKVGIQVNGEITLGTAPPDLREIAVHESKSLSQLISHMLKKSDNIIAGSLFKKVGETYFKQPGSWENGSAAVSQILAKKAGVDTSNMSVIDGSGLSLYNYITPKQMLQVLDFAFHNYSTNYELISALPVAGIDGTLKHRLQNITWKLRAKTGTMSGQGINSLAGYVISRDKEPIAFVIIVNGHNGMGWKYKELEDRIVTLISKYKS